MTRVVVVGAGHAGVELSAALLDRGGFSVTLVDEQDGLPYQRPPLSKESLKQAEEAPLPLRAESFYDRFVMRRAVRVAGIDRTRHLVVLADGEQLPYDHLVLATGARSAGAPFLDADGVTQLRTHADAQRLRAALESRPRVVSIGAGFIGLEIAAAAAARGCAVDVVDVDDRVLARAVSPETSAAVVARHRASGIRFRFGEGVESIERIADESVVTLAQGSRLHADLVVAGIGIRPRTELAEAAGLDVSDGVVVDGHLRTSDPAISAIGDCTRFPSIHLGADIRLESVQNATDQARHLADVLAGTGTEPYSALPWFWSVQGGLRLQIAGISRADDTAVSIGDPADGAYSVLRFRDGALACVESVNDPRTHMAARRLLGEGRRIEERDARRPGFDLRAQTQQSTPQPGRRPLVDDAPTTGGGAARSPSSPAGPVSLRGRRGG